MKIVLYISIKTVLLYGFCFFYFPYLSRMGKSEKMVKKERKEWILFRNIRTTLVSLSPERKKTPYKLNIVKTGTQNTWIWKFIVDFEKKRYNFKHKNSQHQSFVIINLKKKNTHKSDDYFFCFLSSCRYSFFFFVHHCIEIAIVWFLFTFPNQYIGFFVNFFFISLSKSDHVQLEMMLSMVRG